MERWSGWFLTGMASVKNKYLKSRSQEVKDGNGRSGRTEADVVTITTNPGWAGSVDTHNPNPGATGLL